MSAWGISNFENDTALAWIEELVQEKDGGSIKQLVKDFVQTFDPEETTLIECSKFLAVAEVLAGLIGAPCEDFPTELNDWIDGKYIKIEKDILTKAQDGVALIVKESEAKEMFLDSGYFSSWEKEQKNLIKRLGE